MGDWRGQKSVEISEGDLDYRQGIVGDEGW